MKVHLQKNDSSYKIFLYVFYASAFIMCSITIFGFYAMIQEWSTKGTYVMGEVLVKTEFPTPHFAKLLTWLFFTSIVSWYCVSRLGWKRTVTVSKWKLIMRSASACWERLWLLNLLTAAPPRKIFAPAHCLTSWM